MPANFPEFRLKIPFPWVNGERKRNMSFPCVMSLEFPRNDISFLSFYAGRCRSKLCIKPSSYPGNSRKFEGKEKKKTRGCGGENVGVGGIRRRSASFHHFRHAQGINQHYVDEFPPIWRNFQVVLETLDSETCTFNFLSNLIFFHIILFMKVVCNVTIYHIYFFQIFWWNSGEPWNFPAKHHFFRRWLR